MSMWYLIIIQISYIQGAVGLLDFVIFTMTNIHKTKYFRQR